MTATNMQEYFRDALKQALATTSLVLTEESQVYLVQLLAEFARSENAYAGVSHGDKPALALFLARAQEAQTEEAVRMFRHLGDSSLYFLGFFNVTISSKAVSPSYYVAMGETAYASVANLVRDQAAVAAAMYAELADRFGELVFLLNAVSLYGERLAKPGEKTPGYLMDLLDRYRKTGRKDLLDLLMEYGMPAQTPKKALLH